LLLFSVQLLASLVFWLSFFPYPWFISDFLTSFPFFLVDRISFSVYQISWCKFLFGYVVAVLVFLSPHYWDILYIIQTLGGVVFMEIDLNHPVTEVEKNSFCTNGDSSSSSYSSSSPVSSSIYLELWHACAGPLTSLPKKGNVVVYFPQGHLEQLASSSPFSHRDMPNFDLHPQIFCKVVNVQLLVSFFLFFPFFDSTC